MPRLLAWILVLGLAAFARAQGPGFWFMPNQAGEQVTEFYAFARDGSFVGGTVAYATSGHGGDPLVWTQATGRQVLSDGDLSTATSIRGVSADAQIFGCTQSNILSFPGSQRPCRRLPDGSYSVISPPGSFNYGICRGLSDDGNVVAGTWTRVFSGGTILQPFVWTPSGGTVLIGQQSYGAQAMALSRDGSTVVGDAELGSGAFAWTAATGFQTLVPPQAGLSCSGEAVNTNGSIIAGYSSAGLLRWTDRAAANLGAMPGYSAISPKAISDAGDVIAGSANSVAMIWSESTGFMFPADYFAAKGASLPAGLAIIRLTAMSPDGRTFAGACTLNSAPGNYVVRLPGCGSADFDGDGDVGTDSDITAFFAALAGYPCPTCGSADFNGDGDVGTDVDIEAFFRVLAGGPC